MIRGETEYSTRAEGVRHFCRILHSAELQNELKFEFGNIYAPLGVQGPWVPLQYQFCEYQKI